MDRHDDCLFQKLPGGGNERVATSILQQQEIDAVLSNGWCPAPALSVKQAAGKLRRIDDTKESMSDRTAKYEERVQLHTALQPAVCCKIALAWPKMQTASGEERAASKVPRAWRRDVGKTVAHQRRQQRHEQSH